MTNDQLHAELARLRAEQAALLAVNETMRASRDRAALYSVVADKLSAVFPFDSLFIALYDPESDTIRFDYTCDEGAARFDGGDVQPVDQAPLSAPIIRRREISYIEDLDLSRPSAGVSSFGNTARRSRAWLGVPMLSGDTIQGVLSVQSYQPAAFSQADADLLLLLASQIGVAIENARLVEQLRQRIAELSAPLMPVADSVLVLPLVGRIDDERAERLLEQVLAAVVDRQADELLIDVTGVGLVDGAVVAQLLKIVRAAGLLGAHSSVVGVSAAMAQTAVTLGLDLGGLTTYRDLQSALRAILPSVVESYA